MTFPSDTGSEWKAKTRGGGGGGGGRWRNRQSMCHVSLGTHVQISRMYTDLDTAADICNPSAPMSSCNAKTKGVLETHGSEHHANSEWQETPTRWNVRSDTQACTLIFTGDLCIPMTAKSPVEDGILLNVFMAYLISKGPWMSVVKTMMANHIEIFEGKCLKKSFNSLYIALWFLDVKIWRVKS